MLLGDGINHTHMENRGTPVSVQPQGPLSLIFYRVPPASQLLTSINYPCGHLSVSPPPSAAYITIIVYSDYLWRSMEFTSKGNNERTDWTEEQTNQWSHQYFPFRCVICDIWILTHLLLKSKKGLYHIISDYVCRLYPYKNEGICKVCA